METAIWQNFIEDGVYFVGISNTNNQNIINNFEVDNFRRSKGAVAFIECVRRNNFARRLIDTYTIWCQAREYEYILGRQIIKLRINPRYMRLFY